MDGESLKEGTTIATDEHFSNTGNVEIVDGTPTVEIEMNIGEMFEQMDEEQFKISPFKDYGDKYYAGNWVHCNRFNGPSSDDIHYRNTNPKAWVNFAESDCDIALAQSTLCYGHSYCNQSGPAAGCSTEIGHSTTYHKH